MEEVRLLLKVGLLRKRQKENRNGVVIYFDKPPLILFSSGAAPVAESTDDSEQHPCRPDRPDAAAADPPA